MDKLIILIPIVLWSCWSLFQKQGVLVMNPMHIQFVSMIVCFCCAPFFYFMAPKGSTITPAGIGWAVAGSLSAIGAGSAFLYALTKLPAATATSLGSTYPLLTALFAAIFLGETMTLPKIGGMICIVCGAFLLTR